MGARATRLSDLKIKAAKPKDKDKDKDYTLTDGNGLQLRVRTNGSRLWNFNVSVRPGHLPSPAKPRHGVHLNLSGHQF